MSGDGASEPGIGFGMGTQEEKERYKKIASSEISKCCMPWLQHKIQ